MSVETVFWKIRWERGKTNEDKVRSALDYLKEEGKIEQVIRTKSLDIKGIDFLAINGSKRYKLSVKSSVGGMKKDLEIHPERHRHGDIIFIIPQKEETPEKMAERIINLIDGFEERMHAK